jgi:methionine biosynthesis protein MetW
MDLIDYYDQHWTELPEGDVDWDRLQMIVSRVNAGDRVLEAGCGPGFLAKLLADKGAHVVGTDVSHVGARRTAARGIETHHVDLDTMRLPFPDEHFDTVVCNSNLEHLFYLDRNVAECLRVLRRGGTFVWMEPNSAHWRYRLWLLFGRWPYIPNSPTDPYHIRHLTAYELRRHCARNGVQVVETRGHAGSGARDSIRAGLAPRHRPARRPRLPAAGSAPAVVLRALPARAGVKLEHKEGLVGLDHGHAHATPAAGAAA